MREQQQESLLHLFERCNYEQRAILLNLATTFAGSNASAKPKLHLIRGGAFMQAAGTAQCHSTDVENG